MTDARRRSCHRLLHRPAPSAGTAIAVAVAVAVAVVLAIGDAFAIGDAPPPGASGRRPPLGAPER
ncbi:hypothetical protein [Kitasatospora sp. NPDC090308]|uniref:hypothetical protein n=1 Tax=Kitasatospora sp. NPDC090308 TaxID=3364082 RepID=UPI00380D00C8